MLHKVVLKSGRIALRFQGPIADTGERVDKIIWWDDIDGEFCMSDALNRVDEKRVARDIGPEFKLTTA